MHLANYFVSLLWWPHKCTPMYNLTMCLFLYQNENTSGAVSWEIRVIENDFHQNTQFTFTIFRDRQMFYQINYLLVREAYSIEACWRSTSSVSRTFVIANIWYQMNDLPFITCNSASSIPYPHRHPLTFSERKHLGHGQLKNVHSWNWFCYHS